MHQNGTYWLLALDMPSPSAFLPLKIGFTGAASLAPQAHTSPPPSARAVSGCPGCRAKGLAGGALLGRAPPAASAIKVRQSPGTRGLPRSRGLAWSDRNFCLSYCAASPRGENLLGGAKSSLPPASQLQESPLAFPAVAR